MVAEVKNESPQAPEVVVLPPSHDIQLFSQLLYTTNSTSNRAPDFSLMMAQKLQALLPDGPKGLINAVLLMPNLGNINVKAHGSTIELKPENKQILGRLAQAKDKIAAALSDALGKPIHLEVHGQASDR